MAFDKAKVVNELYEKYEFLGTRKYIFSGIVCQSLENANTYEEAIAIGEKNIRENIISRMGSGLFLRLFHRTVDRIGIRAAFDFYNDFFEKTGMTLGDYELIRISQRPEYGSFFESVEPDGNKFLEDVIDIYNSDANIDIDSGEIVNASARAYINSIKRNKILNAEEEAEAFRKYRETNDEEYKEQIINSNLRLVVNLAIKRYVAAKEYIKLDLLDLIQAGNIGLLKSFDRYDETIGTRFPTYAVKGIKKYMSHLMCEEGYTIKIPDWAPQRVSLMRQFKNEYLQKYHVEAPKEKVMAFLGTTEDVYDELIKIERIINVESYDVPVDEDGETNMIDLVEDTKQIGVEDNAINGYFTDELLAYAKEMLDPIKYKVILESCGFNSDGRAKDNTEIAIEINRSGERVRQLIIQAIQKLQSNAYKINNGIRVDQEYFSIKDLKKIMESNGVKHIRVVQHCVQAKTSIFKCNRCHKTFREEAKEFVKRLECPYCSEMEKLIPPKKYLRKLSKDN